MTNMLTDYFFWFAQPSLILNNYDNGFFYFFGGLVLLSFALWISKFFVKHPVASSAIRKVRALAFWIGVSGIIWFAFRYENTPIFAKRFWAGIVIIIGLLWAAWLIKYFIKDYRRQKMEFDQNALKSKYMPKTH